LLYDPLYRAFAEQRYFLIRLRLVVFAAYVPILWVLTNKFGLVGGITSVVIVLLTERVVSIIRFCRILGVSWGDWILARDVGKLTLAAVAAALPTALLRSHILGYKPFYILLICGTVFSVIYAAGVYFLGVPTDEEKRLVLDRLKMFRWRESGSNTPA
jgi:hypothetical protein